VSGPALRASRMRRCASLTVARVNFSRASTLARFGVQGRSSPQENRSTWLIGAPSKL
jgi:hypothetical protein